jgi:hypothetical protein
MTMSSLRECIAAARLKQPVSKEERRALIKGELEMALRKEIEDRRGDIVVSFLVPVVDVDYFTTTFDYKAFIGYDVEMLVSRRDCLSRIYIKVL